ncbi:MAG: hypothetical protein CL944_02075 [Candidatus Diapherotrites archaeon]|uniref:Uncharacterized protein n=1 Tax=Candidatus Iainarchaeum sp. TaxID=3101447 RepID=A0A2D6LPX5_9ARCH|nr:hypothetical protein [Candidatus Diapherotrites archaeon]|tara:strand:- start:8682 stop:10991 length:2310 start_codon:yes stop_codon:yes gene_type:complete
MDAKRKQAILVATKKLLESKTPEKEILDSLGEFGVTKQEALALVKEATASKTNPKPEPKSVPQKKTELIKKPIPGLKVESKQDLLRKIPKQKIKIPLKKDSPEKDNLFKQVEEQTKELEKEPKTGKKSLFSGFLGKREISPKMKKTFIPKLKKGGKVKVKEIIADSPLEKNQPKKQDKKPIVKSPVKKEPAQKKEVNKDEPKKETVLNSEIKKLEKKTNPPKGLTSFSFSSGLDVLEKKVEKGKNIETAVKEMTQEKAIKKIKTSEVTILIIPNKEYIRGMSTLLIKAGASYKKIIYVNLNEVYKSLMQHLKSLNLKPEKFFFVDAVTLTSDKSTTKEKNTIFVSSPNSLIELSLGITQALNTQNADALLFDSLSTLLIYEKESTVTKFIHSLIGKIKASGIDAFFTALEGDYKSESIKDLGMFVDHVNTLTEFELGEMGFPDQQSSMRLQPTQIKKTLSVPKLSRNGLSVQNEQNKIVTREMDGLKQRLQEMQNTKEVTKSLNELKGKISKIDELKNLQEQVKGISKKLEKKPEKTIDKSLINEISRLEKKIDSTQKKKIKSEDEQANKEIQKALKALNEKITKIENLSSLQVKVKSLSEKIEMKKAKPVDNRLVNQISKLEKKIGSLEERLSKKMREKKSKDEKRTLKEKLSIFKKQIDLEHMMNDFYKTDVSKINPENVMTKKLVQNLDNKTGVLTKAYKKGIISKNKYTKGKRRIKREAKRLKHAAQMNSFEKKLDALNEAYDSGVISKESYTKGKSRLEKLLKA